MNVALDSLNTMNERTKPTPDPLQHVVWLLTTNERLQGVPRPIIEVCAEELVKLLNARIPQELQNQGLDVLEGNWVAMRCMGCGTLTPAPRVSQKYNVSKAPMCSKCKDDFANKVKADAPRSLDIYEYTDAEGQVHTEPSLELVPEQFKEQAKVLKVPGGVTTINGRIQSSAALVLAKLHADNKEKGGLAGVLREAGTTPIDPPVYALSEKEEQLLVESKELLNKDKKNGKPVAWNGVGKDPNEV